MSELPTLNPAGSLELPVVGTPHERADAARNRQRILRAAEELFAEAEGCDVSMDTIAAAAGVGKGTLFRRFGDRAGLMRALLDETESAFQEAVIRGEPPLGPGASPVDRLVAFGEAHFELLERHGTLIASAEAGERGNARFESPVYSFYRTHIAMLVRECDPRIDSEYVAEALLAPLAAEVFLFQRRAREWPLERIVASYAELVRRLLG
jgi:AcrR family transcriptional regulator